MIRFIICCGLLVTASQFLLATSVPVFGYALRNWPADPHVLTVGGQAEAERLSASFAAARTARGLAAVNLAFEFDSSLPNGQVELRMPHANHPWFRGALPDQAFADVIDSPGRERLFDRLTAGDSVVWVIVQSGKVQADRELEERLRLRLSMLERVIELPEIDPDNTKSMRTLRIPGPELRIRFTIITVPANDPNELWFEHQIRSLVGATGINLGTNLPMNTATSTVAGPAQQREAVVMPVYGQGLAFYAFTSAELTPEAIDDATLFLCGKCSCELKSENPGVSLLVAGDWYATMESQSQVKDQRGEAAQAAQTAMTDFPPRGFLPMLALLIVAIAAVAIMASARRPLATEVQP